MGHLVELQMMSGRCFCIGMVARRVWGSGDVKNSCETIKTRFTWGILHGLKTCVCHAKESEGL